MKLDHKHLIINATVKKPPVDPHYAEEWMKDLVHRIGMKIKIGPFADYCLAEENNGITGAVCIETSHCSIHAWDKVKQPYIRADIYSCSTFDINTVFEAVKEFHPIRIDWILLDRNDGIQVCDSGKIEFEI